MTKEVKTFDRTTFVLRPFGVMGHVETLVMMSKVKK